MAKSGFMCFYSVTAWPAKKLLDDIKNRNCLSVSTAVWHLRWGGGDLRRSMGLLSGRGGGIWNPNPELPSSETGCTGAAMPWPFAPSPVPACGMSQSASACYVRRKLMISTMSAYR